MKPSLKWESELEHEVHLLDLQGGQLVTERLGNHHTYYLTNVRPSVCDVCVRDEIVSRNPGAPQNQMRSDHSDLNVYRYFFPVDTYRQRVANT